MGTPDGEGDEKEKVEEMEKDAFVTRFVFHMHFPNATLIRFLYNLVYRNFHLLQCSTLRWSSAEAPLSVSSSIVP